MITTPGYRCLQPVYEDENIWIAYAHSDALSRVVLWKMVKEGPRAMIENAKLIHEYETLALLPMEGVLKPHTLLRQGRSMVLLFDIINSMVLRQLMAEGPIEPIAFLRIAIRVAEVVGELHRHELLHMNLRPDTILLVRDSMQACLTGFSDAVPFRQSLHATRLEGYPPYMAPERTTGIAQQLDGRTDLYSLGVTFYEMLAGELPFKARDPLEWAHVHVAMQPPLLTDVPRPIGAIVAKLLAKMPGDRYQSAIGLRADLKRCLTQLEEQGVLQEFPLGLDDQPTRLAGGAEVGPAALEGDSLPTLPPSEPAPVAAPPIRQSGVTPFSDSGYTQMLDLTAVYRASQIFGSASDPYERVRQLLLLLLQQAGASRGCWVSLRQKERQEQASVELAAALLEDMSWSFDSVPVSLDRFADASSEVIRETASSQTLVHLMGPQMVARIAGMDYVDRSGAQSVLCLPIPTPTPEDSSILLYMENRLSAQAFSLERLDVLGMVAMQLFYATRLAASAERTPASPPSLPGGFPLTTREQEVLELIAAGLSNKEIAAQLVVTAETVKSHVRNIFSKLEAGNRVQAIESGRRHGLLR